MKVLRIDAIDALKKKFPLTNPSSFSKETDKTIADYYAEFILGDKTKKVVIH